MDIEDIWIGITGLFLTLLLIFGIPYAAFVYGRRAERAVLTEVFKQSIEQDYNTGYKDGFESGKQAGIKEILNEQDDARY